MTRLLCTFFLASLCLPLHAAILVRLQNGTEIEVSKAQIEGEIAHLTVGRGTVDLAAAEIADLREINEANPSGFQTNEPTNAELLEQASLAQGLPPAFVKTVARAESNFRAGAVSPKGAVGLMQLMPATATELGVREGIPAENALGGAKYLRQLLLKYNGDARLALAAYNAGPGAVERYHGVPPFPETIAYVNRVLNSYQKLLQTQKAARTSAAGRSRALQSTASR